MNFKTISAACLFTALIAGALPVMAKGNITSETYVYGAQLDIERVIALTEQSGQQCGLVDAQMTYLDSQGQTRVLAYSKLAANCYDGS